MIDEVLVEDAHWKVRILGITYLTYVVDQMLVSPNFLALQMLIISCTILPRLQSSVNCPGKQEDHHDE